MKTETITQQQETAHDEYLGYAKEVRELDHEPIDFWAWYSYWCQQNGFFYDRQSWQ